MRIKPENKNKNKNMDGNQEKNRDENYQLKITLCLWIVVVTGVNVNTALLYITLQYTILHFTTQQHSTDSIQALVLKIY